MVRALSKFCGRKLLYYLFPDNDELTKMVSDKMKEMKTARLTGRAPPVIIEPNGAMLPMPTEEYDEDNEMEEDEDYN